MASVKFLIFLVLLILALSVSFGCERRNKSPVGFGELDRELSEPASLEIGQPTRDTTYSTFVPTGSSGSLLVGSRETYRARALLRFVMSDTQVTNHATIAKLRLQAQKRIGDDPVQIGLYELSVPWSDMGVSWTQADSLTPWDSGGSYQPNAIDSKTMGTADSVTFTIPLSRLSSVLDSSNCGLILVPQGNSVIDLYASETSTPPLLLVHYFKGDSAKIDTSGPEADAFIIGSSYQVPGNRLAVGEGWVFRSLLHFDLSQIPEEATINYGGLRLTVDTSQSFFGGLESDSLELAIHAVTGEWQGGETPFSLEDSAMVKVASDQTHLEVNIASPLQALVSGDNFGLLIKSLTEVSDIWRLVVFSCEAGDSTERPDLVVYYTLPPGPRGE